MHHLVVAFFAIALATLAPPSDAAPPAANLQQSFDLRVPVTPTPFSVAGSTRLVYELHLVNFAPDTLALTGLQVLAADQRRPLARFGTQELAGRIGRLSSEVDAPLQLAPGASAVIYVELALDAAAPPPQALLHRIEYDVVAGREHAPSQVTGARVTVGQQPPAVLGPPLRGGPWVAIYDAAWPRGHRRVIYAIDGQARVPGRHAIDWVKLDTQGNKFPAGRGDVVAARYGYGEPVLAVADAVVAAARDGMAEAANVSDPSENALGEGAGNYLALDLGDGRFVLYEHLKPGSLRVAVGDRVERGQLIAALGFTGDSTGPHLHLHVADAAAPLAAEGLPFVLERYRLLGRYNAIQAVGAAPWRHADDDQLQHHQRPASLSVLEFP